MSGDPQDPPLRYCWPFCPNQTTRPEKRYGALCVLPPGTLHCLCKGRTAGEHHPFAKVTVDPEGQLCWELHDDTQPRRTFAFVALHAHDGTDGEAITLNPGELEAPRKLGQHGMAYTVWTRGRKDALVVRAGELIERAAAGDEFVLAYPATPGG